jgi:hypothetical protein
LNRKRWHLDASTPPPTAVEKQSMLGCVARTQQQQHDDHTAHAAKQTQLGRAQQLGMRRQPRANNVLQMQQQQQQLCMCRSPRARVALPSAKFQRVQRPQHNTCAARYNSAVSAVALHHHASENALQAAQALSTFWSCSKQHPQKPYAKGRKSVSCRQRCVTSRCCYSWVITLTSCSVDAWGLAQVRAAGWCMCVCMPAVTIVLRVRVHASFQVVWNVNVHASCQLVSKQAHPWSMGR